MIMREKKKGLKEESKLKRERLKRHLKENRELSKDLTLMAMM